MDFYLILKGWNEAAHPRHPAGAPKGVGGQFAPKNSIGVQLVSPNVQENMTHAEAELALSSRPHQDFVKTFEDVDRLIRTEGVQLDALGAWSDGAENSVVQYTMRSSYKDLRVAAAMKGLLAEQKAVIVFKEGKGPARVYSFDAPEGQNPKELSSALTEFGLPYHTLVRQGRGYSVLIFDDGSDRSAAKKTSKAVQAAAASLQTEVSVVRGKGEVLGDFESREIGREKYEEVIDSYQMSTHQRVEWDRMKAFLEPRVTARKFFNLLRGSV